MKIELCSHIFILKLAVWHNESEVLEHSMFEIFYDSLSSSKFDFFWQCPLLFLVWDTNQQTADLIGKQFLQESIFFYLTGSFLYCKLINLKSRRVHRLPLMRSMLLTKIFFM